MMIRLVTASLIALTALGAAAEHFKVGYAKSDITPEEAMPMWGYGARRDALSRGVRDPLYAKAIVIDTANGKVALVGLDIGRGPTEAMMKQIKADILEQAGIEFVMIVGSHTHHGPVIELLDEEGMGKGKFDAGVRYAEALPGKLTEVILEAAANAQDAKIGWGSKEVNLNRNRHSRIDPKPVDRELAVLRFDDLEGNIIALAVNFAAHPTMLPAILLEYSAEWPGAMMNSVEERLGAPTAFFQGACGDLSPNRTPEMEDGIEGFGKGLADHVVEIAEAIETVVPESPSVQGHYDEFVTPTRVDFNNPLVRMAFAQAFFPELSNAFMPEVDDNKIKSQLITVVINEELALAGISGEVFAALSNRLKERSRAEKTLVFGFCNDHKMYYPTIEGAAEGGYGASPEVSWVELGTGERMMDRALKRIFGVLGAWEPGMIPQPAGVIGSLDDEAGR
jgi:neutral ceramidase